MMLEVLNPPKSSRRKGKKAKRRSSSAKQRAWRKKFAQMFGGGKKASRRKKRKAKGASSPAAGAPTMARKRRRTRSRRRSQRRSNPPVSITRRRRRGGGGSGGAGFSLSFGGIMSAAKKAAPEILTGGIGFLAAAKGPDLMTQFFGEKLLAGEDGKVSPLKKIIAKTATALGLFAAGLLLKKPRLAFSALVGGGINVAVDLAMRYAPEKFLPSSLNGAYVLEGGMGANVLVGRPPAGASGYINANNTAAAALL